VDNGLEMIWKEVVMVAQSKYHQHLPGEAKQNHEQPQPVKPDSSKNKCKALLLHQIAFYMIPQVANMNFSGEGQHSTYHSGEEIKIPLMCLNVLQKSIMEVSGKLEKYDWERDPAIATVVSPYLI
jgi:hypothetical protein